MSTPSVTILKNLVLNWETDQMEEETIATFYRHYDGYPSCHAVDIAKSSVGHPGGCPFSLAFREPPCGRHEGAGRYENEDSGGGFPTLPTACGLVSEPSGH